MRLHLIPVLAAAGALAVDFHHPARRDASNSEHALVKRLSSFASLIITDIQNLTTITNNITSEIKDFTTIQGALNIQTATTDLIDALAKSTADAKDSTAPLSSGDVQALGPITQYLAYAANHSIAELIIKKPQFEKFGLIPLVVTSLQKQISASNNFSSALFPHIPSDLLSVSVALNSQTSDSLNLGLACFQNKNASCITAMVNSTASMDAAEQSGAIPKSAAGRTVEMSGLLGLGAAVVMGVLFAA